MKRAAFVEFLGSMLLAAAVIGSGIMAERLSVGNMAVALLANTLATVAILATLIAASTSFANPAITLGRSMTDSFAGIRPEDVPAFIVAQFAGAVAGVLALRVLRAEVRA